MSLKPQLVEDWRQAHRWWSMRWILLAAVIESLEKGFPLMPQAWQDAIPAWAHMVLASLAVTSLVSAGVSRVLQQNLPQSGNAP